MGYYNLKTREAYNVIIKRIEVKGVTDGLVIIVCSGFGIFGVGGVVLIVLAEYNVVDPGVVFTAAFFSIFILPPLVYLFYVRKVQYAKKAAFVRREAAGPRSEIRSPNGNTIINDSFGLYSFAASCGIMIIHGRGRVSGV